MPKRRFSKKRRTVRRRRMTSRKKSFAKGLRISSQMITYMPKGTKNPFPPRYRTRLYSVLTGSAPNTTSSAWTFVIDQNNILTPWNTLSSGIVTSWPGPNLTIASLNPIGVDALIGTTSPYTHFRVISSRVSMAVNPTDVAGDTNAQAIVIVIVPVIDFAALPSEGETADMIPYSKTSFNNELKGVIRCRNSITVSKLAGVRSRAIEDDLSGAYIGNSVTKPSALQQWGIYVYAPNLVDVGFNYRATISYDVELWNEEPTKFF
nr:MAG: capsid protein [Cressdnaviricota sp.]